MLRRDARGGFVEQLFGLRRVVGVDLFEQVGDLGDRFCRLGVDGVGGELRQITDAVPLRERRCQPLVGLERLVGKLGALGFLYETLNFLMNPLNLLIYPLTPALSQGERGDVIVSSPWGEGGAERRVRGLGRLRASGNADG